MQEKITGRQPVWLQILGSLTALFLLYELVTQFFGLVYYVIDPTTRQLRQTKNTTAASQVVTRDTLATDLLMGGGGVLLLGLGGVVYIGLKWLNRQTEIVRPNLHGLPAVRTLNGEYRSIAPAAPAPAALPAEYQEALPLPGQSSLTPTLPIYTQPLDPRYLLYGRRADNMPIRSTILDRGMTGVFGMTGAGKTEELAALIVQAVRLWREQNVPLELVIFDPKGTDFYGRLPKLPALMPYPVVKDEKDCLELMQTLVGENERRQQELQRAGVVSLAHYQQQGARMPTRLVIVDEVTETLIHMNRSQSEKYVRALQSLAQTGRAAGYRIFVVSQRPAAKQFPREVTGQLEGGRIVYVCDTDIESRIALGDAGAEKLPPTKGAMLYRHGADTVQGQGLYADLKYQFIQWLQGVSQATSQPLLTNQPITVNSSSNQSYLPATYTEAYGGSAEPSVTEPLRGAVETHPPEPNSGDNLTLGERIAAREVPNPQAARATEGVSGPGEPVAAFVPVVPQDRKPRNMAEYNQCYAAVLEHGTLHGALRALYRDQKGAYPTGGPYFYWVRYGLAMALKARGKTTDLKGEPIPSEWFNIPERYDKVMRRK